MPVQTKILIGGLFLIALVALVIGSVVYTREDARLHSEPVRIDVSAEEVSADSGALASGDTLLPPERIRTNESGSALLHFPDASTANIATSTTFDLTESVYTPQDRGMIARFFLASGRMAFSIAELATPESAWEVETGNAVAVVRGTDFTIDYSDGRTWVRVDESVVSVFTKNPDTGERLLDTEVQVEAGTTVDMTDERARAGLPARVVPNVDDTTVNTNSENSNSGSTQTQGASEPDEPAPSPDYLLLEGPNLDRVEEGDVLDFSAQLFYTDGTGSDVTQSVEWQVIGEIGSINQSGQFTAELTEDGVEVGYADGAVNAVWEDTATGALYPDRITFRVYANEQATAPQEPPPEEEPSGNYYYVE